MITDNDMYKTQCPIQESINNRFKGKTHNWKGC